MQLLGVGSGPTGGAELGGISAPVRYSRAGGVVGEVVGHPLHHLGQDEGQHPDQRPSLSPSVHRSEWTVWVPMTESSCNLS
jgi:hypothetical protein